MTYIEVLRYQERTMNDMLCHQWIGFRQDRERFCFQLQALRDIIRRNTPDGTTAWSFGCGDR